MPLPISLGAARWPLIGSWGKRISACPASSPRAQGPHLRGESSASRAVAVGSLHTHRCTGNVGLQSVPAHDERDFDFAKVFDLPIVQVVAPADSEAAKTASPDPVPYTGDAAFTDIATGVMVSSGFITGLTVDEARVKMIAWLEEKGLGKAQTQYKLRDWLFSRQRYWGEPFPIIHYEDGSVVTIRYFI